MRQLEILVYFSVRSWFFNVGLNLDFTNKNFWLICWIIILFLKIKLMNTFSIHNFLDLLPIFKELKI